MYLAKESICPATVDNLAERNRNHHREGGSRRSRDGDQDRLQDQQGTLCSQQAVGHQDSQASQGLEIYTKKLDRQRQPQKIFLGWRRGNKHDTLTSGGVYDAAQGGRTPWNPRTESSAGMEAEPPQLSSPIFSSQSATLPTSPKFRLSPPILHFQLAKATRKCKKNIEMVQEQRFED